MCRPVDTCGCSGGSAAPVALWVAIVVAAALVSAAATLLGQVLIVVLAGVLVAAVAVAGYGVWRVRVLTRPARPVQAASFWFLETRKTAALPAPPLAIEAAKPAVTVVPLEAAQWVR